MTTKTSCNECADVWTSHNVFYSNPSDQAEEKLATLPDWKNVFLNEATQRVIKEKSSNNDNDGGGSSVAETFSAFDVNKDKIVSRLEFAATLRKLGFSGEGSAAIMDAEIDSLMDIANKDGNVY